ncbi:hypothetical protein BJF88_07765 [Cellulosimicrobium sp. CUA-896]|nr:hypothetical protein BJF88_07765 [Cellulosimicrobium sp. CUA-896]
MLRRARAEEDLEHVVPDRVGAGAPLATGEPCGEVAVVEVGLAGQRQVPRAASRTASAKRAR